MAYWRASALLALAVLVSCMNPFATRTPVPPTGGKIELLEPDSAPNVLANFQSIIKNMGDDRYEEGYNQLFDEEFEFFPDVNDRETYSVVFSTPWLKGREGQLAKRLFEKGFLGGAQLDVWSMVLRSAAVDQEEYDYTYSITIQYANPAHQQDDSYPKSLKGTALLLLRETDGTWAVYRWEDRKADESSTSWGGFRAQFSS